MLPQFVMDALTKLVGDSFQAKRPRTDATTVYRWPTPWGPETASVCRALATQAAFVATRPPSHPAMRDVQWTDKIPKSRRYRIVVWGCNTQVPLDHPDAIYLWMGPNVPFEAPLWLPDLSTWHSAKIDEFMRVEANDGDGTVLPHIDSMSSEDVALWRRVVLIAKRHAYTWIVHTCNRYFAGLLAHWMSINAAGVIACFDANGTEFLPQPHATNSLHILCGDEAYVEEIERRKSGPNTVFISWQQGCRPGFTHVRQKGVWACFFTLRGTHLEKGMVEYSEATCAKMIF